MEPGALPAEGRARRTPMKRLAVLALAACADLAAPGLEQEALDEDAAEGAGFFDKAFPRTNGRACATCHIASDHFARTPQPVQQLLAQNPADPLFNRIAADDPTAATPTYDHLKAGLVRVTIRIADNLDVIDAQGRVVTNAARTVDVWRGVP